MKKLSGTKFRQMLRSGGWALLRRAGVGAPHDDEARWRMQLLLT